MVASSHNRHAQRLAMRASRENEFADGTRRSQFPDASHAARGVDTARGPCRADLHSTTKKKAFCMDEHDKATSN
ncbi:hypothetical protein XH90_02210 [Bradyrhizobium sp. CCBAU 53338]|nr:hypothetical protein XH90_02210 [Bradyrhizobium sp. CCBAU 53338]